MNFRVTDEELELLKNAAGRQGARCLSDFARSVMLAKSDPQALSGSANDRLVSLDRRLNALERSMSHLAAALAGAQSGPSGSDN